MTNKKKFHGLTKLINHNCCRNSC